MKKLDKIIDDGNSKFFNSGLRIEKAFYIVQEINFCEKNPISDYIEYNKELVEKYYSQHILQRKEEDIQGTIWYDFTIHDIYYEPLIFNEKIAIECGLIPFTYKGEEFHSFKKLLLTPSDNPVVKYCFSKLDAYQALTHNTIDKGSMFWNSPNIFEHTVGSQVMKKVVDILSIKLNED